MNNVFEWVIDPDHTSIQFHISHMVIAEVTGFITDFEGKLETQNADFSASKLDVSLKANSVSTNNKNRDAHLISADFLDSEKFPEIRFVSTTFRKITDKKFLLDGRLTIKGITLPITLETENKGIQKDPFGNIKTGFYATGKFRRFSYGLTWDKPMENGALFIGSEVRITIITELIKK